mmetsp:Transcript_3417/g.7290  ORF Transcript_3417/g.7290 Transcript_3417/m.7290 type:complete len:180 (-) Transcript_3417:251-790(-)
MCSFPRTYHLFISKSTSQNEEGNIHLDHALNLTLSLGAANSKSLEKTLEQTIRSIEKSCHRLSRSFTLVGYAVAAYFLMAGVGKLMEGVLSGWRGRHLPSPPPPPPPPHLQHGHPPQRGHSPLPPPPHQPRHETYPPPPSTSPPNTPSKHADSKPTPKDPFSGGIPPPPPVSGSEDTND